MRSLMRAAGLALVMAAPVPLPARDAAAQPASAVRASMLVDGQWLADHLEDPSVVVLHVDRNRTSYDAGHIPGARFVDYAEIIVSRDGIATELPPVDRLTALVESLGIGNDTRVVLTGELLLAARMYFTLDWLGHGDRAALLDGGLDAWRTAGRPVTRDLPVVTPARFTPSLIPELVITADGVRDRLDDPATVVLDARALDEYTGEREEDLPRRGHIAGAEHLDWTTTWEEGHLRGLARLTDLFRAAQVAPGQTVVTYCRVGTRASMLYFVSRYLGHATRLYDGSMQEWSGLDERYPVVRGPAPR